MIFQLKTKHNTVGLRRHLSLLLLILLTLLSSSLLGAPPPKEKSPQPFLPTGDASTGYTINFNNVSILEYLKFVSQIGKANFIYQEEELNFNVTILSEEPTRLIDVMAALIQVLKINGFDLIEQGNNFIITKSGKIRQIATVFSEDRPPKEGKVPPIITYVFRVKNANPSRLKTLLAPFLSTNGIIEISEETRHLIITDITQNIEQIQRLIVLLDAPKTALEVGFYRATHNTPKSLIPLADQLITPLSEGNPVILVPQETNQAIFIVSTPFLIQRTISILEDLDLPPSISTSFEGVLTGANLLIYRIKNKPASTLEATLKQIASDLNATAQASQELIETLGSMKYIRISRSLFFIGSSSSLKEVKALLANLDVPYEKKEVDSINQGFYIYKIKNGTEEQIKLSLGKLIDNLKEAPADNTNLISALQSMRWIQENNSLLFVGDESSLETIAQLLPTFDTPINQGKTASRLPLSNDFFIYKPQNLSPALFLAQIKKIYEDLSVSKLADPAFLHALQSGKISTNNSVIFTGDSDSLDRIRTLSKLIDKEADPDKEPSTIYIYHIQHFDYAYIKEELDKLTSSLPEENALRKTIETTRYLAASNSIIFRGDVASINRIKEIISTLDSREASSEFFVYYPKNLTIDVLLTSIRKMADNMKTTGFTDQTLLTTLTTARLNADQKGLLFVGSAATITRVKELLPLIDIPPAPKEKLTEFFVYYPKNLTINVLLPLIRKMADNMKANGFTDQALLTTLTTARLNADQKGLLFVGSAATITRIKELLPLVDIPSAPKEELTEFFVYHPLYKSPGDVIVLTHTLAEDMESGGLKNSPLIKTLKTAQLTNTQKAVLFTGTADSITAVKTLLPKIDRAPSYVPTIEKPEKTGFFIYRPIHISVEGLQQGAVVLGKDMEESGLTNQELINTLQNSQITSNGKAVLFTGSPDTIDQLKTLLPSIDLAPTTPEATSFFIYKLQYLSGPILMEDLRNGLKDLPNTSTNQQIIAAIDSMHFIETSNSIIFNGSAQAIARIKVLLAHFDVISAQAAAAARTVSGYKIYKPQHLSGEELIKILREFEKNLTNSGVTGQPIFDVITHLQWMASTKSILISGNTTAVEEVYALLERFDVARPDTFKEATSEIEKFSDMSFLIYKLEYHSGEEIASAVREIGKEFEHSQSEGSKKLFAAIKALQWIQITNSLISTGDPDALSKLRELIKSIDIPLKQVFVEVLVLETQVGNALNFGLRWGSQGQYRNKFSYATGSFPQNSQNNPDNLSLFQQNLGTISSTTTPMGSFIPFSSGFDLGVIGNIILHKGQSYFSLGSLVNALREDGDSTIVINQKIVTQDNKNSTFFVGQNVPYTGSFVTNSSNNTVQTANLEYRDIGVNLSITPKVGSTNIITLDIEQDISEQANSDVGSSTSTDSVTGITTNKTTSRTVISVPDQSFLVLSGQLQNSKTHTKSAIPCLGGLPLVGAFFSQNDYQKNASNIIIFVRPHVIKSFDEYKEITERQENLFRSQTDDPEAFDAGLETVKTPDDA